MKELILLLCLAVMVENFTFLYPSISVSTLTINQPATYSFYAFRNQDDNLNPTPFASQPVPAGSTITIIFPAQYSLTVTTPVLTTLLINDNPITTFTTTITANNFTISNAIPSSSAIANVTMYIANVTNPYPAITTDPFVVVIGQDVSSSSTTVTLTPGAFQNCSLSFNPAFVNSSAAMIVSVKPTNYIQVDGYIQVEFASNMQWSQDISTSHTLPLSSATCTILSGQVSSASCAGTSATATVDFNINTMNTSKLTQALSFQINGLFTPPTTTPPDTVSITSYSPQGDQIDTCTSLITGLLPQVLAVSLTPNINPLNVNAVSSLTFTFTLTDTISKTDYIQIIFPSGTIFNFNNAISAVNLLLFTSGVTYTSSNLTLISRQSSASPTRFAGTICRIIIGAYTAPPSAKTTGNFILQIYNAQNGLKMQGTATITAQTNTYSMNVTASSYLINQNTAFTFVFTSTDFLTNTSYIILNFPADLRINISSNCLTSNFSSALAASCSHNVSNTIRLDRMTSNGITAGTYSMVIQSLVNPNRAVSSLPFSASFYYINDSSHLVATANFTGLIFLANQLNLNSTTIGVSSYNLLATPISANITFTTKDAINANGFMLITIPNDFNIVTGYIPQCTFTSGVTNVAAACSITGRTFNISLGSNSISVNQTITIGLGNFGTNPKTTKPTSTFQLYLYSPDGFLVNYINSSLTIDNLVPIDFSFITITPSSYNNSASVPYTFYFMQAASWDNNSYLIIQLPHSIGVASTTPVCTNIIANATISCRIINSTNNLNVSLATIGSSLSLSVSLVNPPSYRPTSNFIVTTYTSDGYIYASNNAISVTTTRPSSFQNISYSFSNPYYNQSTNLTFNIANLAAITSSYTLNNANQFTSGSTNISCSSLTATVSCSLTSSSIIITSNNTFPTSTDFTILDLFVPMSNVTQMSLSSFDATFLMSTYSPVTFQTGCSLPCYSCTSAAQPLSCLSCYPTTLFTDKVYYYPNNCYSACPAGTYNASGSTICSACSDPCAECNFGSSVCTECLANSSSPILYLVNNTCISTCPSGTYNNNVTNLTKYTPICSNCVPPCSTCATATICLSCLNASLYYYSNSCIATCPALISIANSTTMVCDPCSPICLTCINTTTTCLSCNTSVAPIYYAQNMTCVSTCPSPLVVDGTNCSACASPCNTCSIAKTNCTSCINGTYLSIVLNGSCLTKCDKDYFGNATTLQCQSCSTVPSLNCKNCLDETRCITCDVGFVFFSLNSSCLPNTPSGYTNVSGIAVACVSNCSECGSLTYNCSACSGTFNLFTFAGSGYCYTTCPNTTLAINNTCMPCTFPCLTCSTTLNNCSSCLTGYLFPNGSLLICITSCPNTTFLDISASICTNCIPPCLTCLGSASRCTSCANSSNYLSNSTCVSSCPLNSLIDYTTMTCYPCLSPCLSCQFSANNCTSCISGYYYLASQNDCLTSCPASIFVADPLGSFTCLACTSNCSTCSMLPSNCTTCGSIYSYFNSTCINACPLGMYSSSNLCNPCVNNCSTCTSASICLTCLNSTIFYQSQCLASCPISASIIKNGICTACSNSCLNCSSSDVCYECPASLALYAGACVSSCPAPLSIYYNTTSYRLNCFSSLDIAAQNLRDTLQITAVLPLPFTIVATFLFLCCLMSKIQNRDTYVTGVGYSIYGVAEASSLVYLFYIYNIGYFYRDDFSLYNLLGILTICMIGLLNLISLACVTPFLVADPEFKNWLRYRRRGTPERDSANEQESDDVQTNGGNEKQNQNVECCSHNCSFAFFTIFSFVTSYKFRLVIFTKLFRFNCLTAHLQDIHGFRAMNILSFFGIIHQGFVCFITVKFLMIFGFSDNKLYLATIDCMIVTLASFLLALLTMQKDDDFFKVHNDFKNGIDLGHRKKDKDLKNYKLDQKRVKGMDSRDKLIDMNYQHTEIEEEEIIVNHNIVSKVNNPKKVGSAWVQVERHKKRRAGKESPRTKDVQNVFDVGGEQYEDSFVPITEKDRIELFHTSLKLNTKNFRGQSKVVESRVDDWVQVDIDNELLKYQSKVAANDLLRQQSKVGQKFQPNYHYYNNVPQQRHPNTLSSRKINFQQSAINIDLNDNFKTTLKQPIIVTSAASPVIKQTSSEYINSKSNKNGSKQDKMQNMPIDQPIEDIIIEPIEVLNKSIEDIRIVDNSVNKSYESILPFVHENGVLKQKKPKSKKEQLKKGSNLMIVNFKNENGVKVENQPKAQVKKQKVDMAVVANSGLFEQEKPKQLNSIKFIAENQVHLSSEIRDISANHNPPDPQKYLKPQQVEKVTQQVQVEDLQSPQIKEVLQQQAQKDKISSQRIVSGTSSNIIIPPLPKKNPNKKLDLNMQQLSEKIEPQRIEDPPKVQPLNNPPPVLPQAIPEVKQIVHAPKIYKSNKILKIDEDSNQLDEFDEQMLKRQEELNRIKMQVQRTAQNNRNLDFHSKKSHKRNRSKQSLSIMSYIDDAKSKQNISRQPSNILIVNEQRQTQSVKGQSNHQSQRQDQIEPVFINQQKNSKIESNSQRSREPIQERTVKNAASSSDNRRQNISYTPSVLSKRTEQPIAKALVQEQAESYKNIFDRGPYADYGHHQQIQPVQIDNEQFFDQDNTQQQFKAGHPEPDYQQDGYEPETNNHYAIHVEAAREKAENERQSQPIEYQSSHSEQISKTARLSHQKGELPHERQISHEENQQAQQQQLEEQQQQVRKSKADLQLQSLNDSLQQRQQQGQKEQQQQSQSRSDEIVDPGEEGPITNLNKPYIAQNNQYDRQIQNESSSPDHTNTKQHSQEGKMLNPPFHAEQASEKYQSSAQQANHSTSSRKQQAPNLFRVEYAHGNLDPQEHSNKQFTVQNINQNYMQVQQEGDISQSNQLSMQLKKTSKRMPTHRAEVAENQPIQLIGGKSYLQSQVPDEDNYTVPGKIRKSRNKLVMEQKPTVPESNKNNKNDHIIDLLKNVNKQVRNKRSMPKQQRDERIAIKIEKSSADKPKVPYESNNLARKSMEKNKPINQFKFERRNQEYGEDQQQYETNYRASRANNKTNINLARPTLIDRSSSLRQSNNTARLGPKQTSLAQNSPPKIREQKMQEIREFNFGDEISSDRSKNPTNSEAELVKWKQQFIKQRSQINMEPEDISQIPRQPILNGPFEEDEELQVIEERKISRKRNKKGKPKVRRESREKRGQLQRIYGR